MKCDKCQESEATVYYTVISGKFKATRKNYCRPCMEKERIRIAVPQEPTGTIPKAPGSFIDLIQTEMSKKDEKASANESNGEQGHEKRVKQLEQKMKIAIGEERYEDAAKIRDEISSIKPPRQSGDDHKGSQAKK